ncbi:hypothetical protein ACFLXH_06035 [Chloroflexota bacterium]
MRHRQFHLDRLNIINYDVTLLQYIQFGCYYSLHATANGKTFQETIRII